MDPIGLNFTLLGAGDSPNPHPNNKDSLFSKKVGNFLSNFHLQFENWSANPTNEWRF